MNQTNHLDLSVKSCCFTGDSRQRTLLIYLFNHFILQEIADNVAKA